LDCERHPGQKTIGRCLECGKGICPQCVTDTDQVLVCPECFQKEIDQIAFAMEAARGKAPKARKPKKGELPVAPEVAPPPAVKPQQAASLLDVIPAAEQLPPPAEAPSAFVPPPGPPPVEEVTAKPRGKAGKEKPPRAKKEKPPREKKRKKGEAPVAPEVALPPLVPGMEASPATGAPLSEFGVPAKPKGRAGKKKPPKARKEKPPKARKTKKGEMPVPTGVLPPTFMPTPTGVPSEEEAPPVYEEATPAPEVPAYEPMPPQPEYEQPPTYKPPAHEPPSEEPPVEGGLPAGFDEGEGMMEQVRPEHVTGEEYLPSPEHQELLGQPRDEAVEPWEETGEAAPVEQISEVTVAPGEEAEVSGEDWPIEETPATEALGEPTPPPPPPPPSPFEGPAQAEPVEPAVEEEVVDVSGEEEYGEKVDETESPEQPPGRRTGTQEELHSFFFEDEIDKKGKDQKRDKGSFWE